MASINKAMLIGHLGADPELRYLPDGTATAILSVATSDRYTDRAGQKQERTEWHRVALYGKLAEIAGEYLKKGAAVYVEGSLRTRKWQDRDGHDRTTTEIRAERMQMLGGKPQPACVPQPADTPSADDDWEVPF